MHETRASRTSIRLNTFEIPQIREAEGPKMQGRRSGTRPGNDAFAE